MMMFLFHIYGISLIVCIGFVSGLMSGQLTARVYEEFEGKIMSKFSRKIIYDMNLAYCHMQCLADEECMSFFYHRGNKTCQTHGVVFFNPDDGDFSPGTKYYRTTQDSYSVSLGYFYNRALNFCYKPHFNAPMTFNSSARQVCQNEGGELIIIDTKQKLDHIAQTITASTFPASYFLIGAREVVANDWRWMDGRNITEDFWCPEEPESTGTFLKSAFVVISKNGSVCMVDYWETLLAPFFCELKV